MAQASRRSSFLPLMVSVVAFAWAALWLWERSPYGRYLDHGDWTQAGLAGSICAAVPSGEILVPAILYVGGWVLMLAAMMLPTTLPLLEIFRRLTRRRPDRRLLMSLVVLGYLMAWLGFGILAHIVDWAVHEGVARVAWLTFNGWVLGAAVFFLAGVFQFSRLKYACLDKCRLPFGRVIAHWRGGPPRRQAFMLGLDHGLFCVGCCWAIMLLMFVIGTGSVGWMLLLGGVMAAEKNLPWGRRLSAPLGVTLIAIACLVTATNLLPQ